MSTIAEPRAFELIAGNPALDLVNTLDWRFRETGTDELLASYDDLLHFSRQSGLLTSKQIKQIMRSATESEAADALVSCRQLREAMAQVLYAFAGSENPSPSSLKSIDRFYKEAVARQQLLSSSGRLHWGFPAAESSPEVPLWLIALAAERLLVSDQLERLRECGNSDCRWLFLDTSKNHTRRWCDMKICGNRIKARRFKAHHKA